MLYLIVGRRRSECDKSCSWV